MEGRKYDQGKPEWWLLPFLAVQEIVKVLTYGSTKYDPFNWKKVPNAKNRYFSAFMRHVIAWWEGEQNDPETGFNHLAHAGCCLLYLLWFDLTGQWPKDNAAETEPKQK